MIAMNKCDDMANSNGRQTQKDVLANPNYYQKGLGLAEAGRYAEALACIQEYLGSAPNDAEALNDAGAILHCLGCSDEAINHLTKARSIRGDSAEITWNLSESYLAAAKANEAMELFDGMEQMGILNADVLNRTANIFLNEGDLANALKMLIRSLQVSPDQEVLKPMIEVIRSKIAGSNCE